MRRRQPWLGNGDGHVYEHVATPPEARTWGPLDCPSFVRIEHPENWKTRQEQPKAYKKRKPKSLLALALLVHKTKGE